jgi:cobalt-zinc-cadmium efflux system protein
MPDHEHCNHDHHSAAGMTESRIKLSLLLTFCFVVVEFISGIRANSLALLSDSGHNFSDGFALLLSWYALHVAQKPATSTRTYGFHRVGILTALFNAITLVAIAVFIFTEAYHLFVHPEHVVSGLMIAVATIALVLNTTVALALRGEARHDVNIRGAYVHMAGDAISSIGVVVAGTAIHFTGWSYADPLVSVLIGVFIIYNSWGIVRETINVLLEGSPLGMDVDALVSEMQGVPGVEDVHDLHVWTIANGMNALSCHVMIEDACTDRAADIVATLKSLLLAYNVPHSTLETECGGCDAAELYCQLKDHHRHDHHSSDHNLDPTHSH